MNHPIMSAALARQRHLDLLAEAAIRRTERPSARPINAEEYSMTPTHRAVPGRLPATLIAVFVLTLLAAPLLALPAAATPPPTCNGKRATIWRPNRQVTGTPSQINPNYVGTAGADVIVGTSGIDGIQGKSGNDTICGGGGADRITGDAGHDMIFGESGSDPALLGQDGDDVVVGGTGNDFVAGHAGRDRCDGGNGTDTTVDLPELRRGGCEVLRSVEVVE